MTARGLFREVRSVLAKPGSFRRRYDGEDDFETDVWRVLRRWAKQRVPERPPKQVVLTSHTKRVGRSAEAWRQFCAERRGPDVNALDSNNRVDIVVRHPSGATVGIEVECLGAKGHATKLVHGLGQAVLALAHRDSSILLIHCGSVTADVRAGLRKIIPKICAGSRLAVIVAPE